MPVPASLWRRVPRVALAAHGATLAAALGVWAYLDRNLWFFGDEWDFLTRRGLHGAYFSLWAPHNEHWSVLPILLWRAIYSVEHLSTYWPYLAPLLVVHALVVHLIWRRCLREGADPWVATAVALLFALLGTGAENLTWAFQIGFVSSLLFGFLALEVAEGTVSARAPRLSRPLGRDLTAAVLALAAMMCSTVGLATTLALAVVELSRHGPARTARALVIPLGSYGLWFALAGHVGLRNTGDTVTTSVLSKAPRFVFSNLSAAMGHMAGWGAGGPALAVILAVWLLWSLRSLVRRHPAVVGSALAAVAFYFLAALGRDRIGATLSPSRYAYVGAALLLPAFALLLGAAMAAAPRLWSAAPSLAVRGRAAGAVRAVLVLVVVAATASNMVAGVRFARSRTVYVRGLENQIVTSAALLQSPVQFARAVDIYPIWASGFAAGYLTPGVLAQLYRRDLLPRPRPGLMTSAELLNDESWLDLSGRARPLFAGRFGLVGGAGVQTGPAALAPWPLPASARSHARRPPARRAGAGGAHNGAAPARLATRGWPPGPGLCAIARPFGRYLGRSFPTSLRFAMAGKARSAALWLSLGHRGGVVLVYLALPWGLEGFPGGTALEGQQLRVPSGGHLWVSDSVPGDELVVQVPARAAAEVCALRPGAPAVTGRTGPVLAAA